MRTHAAKMNGILVVLTLMSWPLLLAEAAKVGTNGKSSGQRFALEPQDHTAIVGTRVTLPCRIIDKTGTLQWTKDDFGLGTHRNLSGFERYSMIGSDEEGDFSLEIYPVILDDDAKYQCQVGPGPDGEPGIRSRFASLTVLVPPEAPKIVQGEFMVTTEDREIELECVSVGGKPAAELTWIDGHGNVLTDGIEYVKEPITDSRRFTAKSILKLTPKKEHHNTTFTCQAQNTADRTYRSAKIKMEVKYAPKVSVSVIGGALAGGRIPEGAEVRFSCRADANPAELTYRWYLNDELQIGDYTTEMLIHNISRDFHDKIIKCEVHNAVGKSEESKTLDISYGPIFRQRPASVEADAGAVVSLVCDVDGNPTPDIVWIHDPTNRIVSNSPNLTMSVNSETVGKYYCKASVMGFADIGAEATIYLKRAPAIASAPRQYGLVGDTAQVHCVAFSVPRARHVMWTFNGREINSSNDNNFSVLEDPLPEGVKSTLIIRESQSKHFGRYNCTVVNDYGSDYLEIDLIAQTIAPSLIIIVCVGLSVAIVVLVIIFMCIFMRRGKRKLPPADLIANHHHKMNEKGGNGSVGGGGGGGGCKDSDRSSNISDLKAEIRSSAYDHDYSEAGSDSIANRLAANMLGNSHHNINQGVPLAGPVQIPNDYRYSTGDYVSSLDQLQFIKGGHQNNAYVAYVDYSRDYNPPSAGGTLTGQQKPLNTSVSPVTTTTGATNSTATSYGGSSQQLYSTPGTYAAAAAAAAAAENNKHLTQDNGLPIMQNNLNMMHQNHLLNNQNNLIQNGLSIDPRYSAVYGNPYLRQSNNALPPLPPPSTANPSATPAPPPYSRQQQHQHQGSNHLGMSPGSLVAANLLTKSSSSNLSNSNLAISNSNNNTLTSNMSNNSSSLNIQNQLSSGNGGGGMGMSSMGSPSSGSNSTTTSSGQFILPSNGTFKKTGSLATHV